MVFNEFISNDYLRALIVFLFFLILLRVFVSISQRILLKLVKKTKTDLDDKIIKKSFLPGTIILFFICVRIGFGELIIQEGLKVIIYKLIYSGIAVSLSYLTYAIADLIILSLWNKFVKKTDISVGKSLGYLIHGMIKALLIILSILYILYLWNIDIGPLLTGLGIAGLAIALALQPALGNIFSGISVILDESVKIGDVINLGSDNKGVIEKIGLRSTKIRTFDNELVIIPNSVLAQNNIQNIALPEPKSRIVIPFSVAYGSDIDKVKKIVLNEIKTIKNLSENPDPNIYFLEMGESSLNFKAFFHVDSYEYKLSATDEANTKIYNILRKNKIEIPFPQRDIHLKKK